jgi:hypothetical protein
MKSNLTVLILSTKKKQFVNACDNKDKNEIIILNLNVC